MSRTEHFEQAWPYLEPAVVRFRQHTKESVFKEIEGNRARLWMLDNSAVVTTIRKFPCGRKSYQFWLAGGDLDEIVDMVNGPATRTALAEKCDEMRIIGGRRGWLRALGWRDVATVAVKDLDHD